MEWGLVRVVVEWEKERGKGGLFRLGVGLDKSVCFSHMLSLFFVLSLLLSHENKL